MIAHKTKVITLIVVLVLVMGSVMGFIIYRYNDNSRLPKDDSYFWNKYGHDIQNHDACISEFIQKGQTEGRMIGIPCPGEPQ